VVAQRLAVAVECGGRGDSAAEHTRDPEYQGGQPRDLASDHCVSDGGTEVLPHQISCQVLAQVGPVRRITGENRDHQRVALVAGPRVGEVVDPHRTSRTSTCVVTSSRGSRQDRTATGDVTEPRAPPPPAGPFV
jgi:hypothetical protein